MTARKSKRKRRWFLRIALATTLVALILVFAIGIMTQRTICKNTAARRTVTQVYIPFWRWPPPWYRQSQPSRGYALVVWQRVEEHYSAVESFLEIHKFKGNFPEHEWIGVQYNDRTLHRFGRVICPCYPRMIHGTIYGPFRGDPEELERYLEAQQAADPNFVDELYQHMQNPRTTEAREWRRMHRDRYREWSSDLEGSDTPSSDPVPGR